MQRRTPGLETLNESRERRARQLATGRAAWGGGIPPKVFLWGLFVLFVGGVFFFWREQADLENQRGAIMTKQRAAAKLLGPKLVPMRELLERSVAGLAKEQKDSVEADVDWDKLFRTPGLYMRVRLADAKDPETFRKAASNSLRDGFSACLIQDPSASLPTAGKECLESNDCESGQFCNEYQICQRPSSPFNMRMLYRALSVLTEKWVTEVREAGTELSLVAYDRTLDSVTKVDLPLAIEIYQRAQYAVVVLDEDPKGGLPKPIAGADESEAERVQRVAHRARIGVFDLPTGKLLARVTQMADGELRDVGKQKLIGGEASAAARARQANSCGLALAFRERISPTAPEAPSLGGDPPGTTLPSKGVVDPAGKSR